MERFPSDDTIRNFFLRFSQAHIEAFWLPLWRWLLLLVKCPAAGFALDLDSTVFCREGKQEGARKGFNPRRQGRNSHHPLLAVLAEAPFILHGWLRSGNTGAARGVVPFLQEALALLPEGTWLRTVRADGGFFDGNFLDYLEEERALPYVVVARLTTTLKRKCAGIQEWTPIDEHHAAGEFTVKLFGWSKERRFVVVRERIRETKAAVGRLLIDVPGYTFRVWVTNRSQGVLELWRDYNGRACVEQRIEELKRELAAPVHPPVRLLNGIKLPASVIRRIHVPIFGLAIEVKHPQRGQGDAIGFNRRQNRGELLLRFPGGCARHPELTNKQQLPRGPRYAHGLIQPADVRGQIVSMHTQSVDRRRIFGGEHLGNCTRVSGCQLFSSTWCHADTRGKAFPLMMIRCGSCCRTARANSRSATHMAACEGHLPQCAAPECRGPAPHVDDAQTHSAGPPPNYIRCQTPSPK